MKKFLMIGSAIAAGVLVIAAITGASLGCLYALSLLAPAAALISYSSYLIIKNKKALAVNK